ncbi:MAG TPA: toxic anion resistance protein [Paracoccaceae bacterium]|nr:toxic anion resistance protein [Paracoccaceae bacterium]
MTTREEEAAKLEAEAARSLATLPEPEAELVSYDTAPVEVRQEIERRMGELDLRNSQTIIKFGSGAQQKLTAISDQMLEGVRNQDLGPAGDALRNMVGTIRGFDASELDPDMKRSWWQKLLGRSGPIADFIMKYEDVRGQIDAITDELLGHETRLLKDVKLLDKLYEQSLGFYRELGLYIAAGEARIREIDTEIIPKEAADVEAEDTDQVLEAQELRDIRVARDELERRVHDMKLTRQVTMQSLPSIRLVQENDKSLITKINSVMVNTVPLWKNQLAIALATFRGREAGRVVKEATDLTNELLTSNAEMLRKSNAEIREQIERGVFDIEAVRQANSEVIATIEDSLRIADEGKQKRAAAEQELIRMEEELKQTLAAARAGSRVEGPSPSP